MKRIVFFVVLIFTWGCSKDKAVIGDNKKSEIVDEDGTPLSSEIDNKDDLCFYYKDSIDLIKILGWPTGEIQGENLKNFSFKDGKLILLNQSNMDKAKFTLSFSNKVTKEKKTLTFKLKGWIDNQYYLERYEVFPKQNFFVYTFNNNSYFFSNNKLYIKRGKTGDLEFLCDFPLVDLMYNQMVTDGKHYAVRTGNNLYVSENLKNWKLIYSESRGIKESMVIVNNENGKELLFSEYNPGTNYKRQAVRAYNFSTGKTSIRKLFYSRLEYESSNALPTTRHIHFLLKDPYSNLLFLGNGDLNYESAIYYSSDNGLTFNVLGGGDQTWRSLSMFFTKQNIFWTTDAASAQYMLKLSRNEIKQNVEQNKVTKYPLVNSALWCSEQISENEYLQSTNNEGGLYDNKYRNLYIKIENEEPQFYSTFAKTAGSIYAQKYPVGKDVNGNIYLLDLDSYELERVKVKKIK
ncbi:hypothetical protein AAW12_11605 [Sphingobacterium sp. Ag1]|uniref:hypothetical protein n=1 Tax=Sphingobacterium sp. Ag1 TaxID=1643451 RepID=UPI00062805E6|nr:hypothetical protein [Sphingobacterium sp. Ag1]KKO91169.1 hypothetical protein AAW12_11605 [Sphingobacterium sp. Ag1]